MPETPAAPRGIDPRGPRFAAGITSFLLVIALFLALTGLGTSYGMDGWAIQSATVAERASTPAFLLLVAIALLFLWSLISPRTQPWSALFRTVVQPRLSPPSELEDPRPPRFAQGVGFFVVTVGLVLQLVGVPWALSIAAGAAFFAAFLNAAFGICLGCMLYLLLQRIGVVGRARPSAA
ncbi:DUF4395 domain-containing protein [Microbacterium sp.]|uniref:DUF4395 domain-containing protein n=1 Tax=Microbacterium sp. TaxID=51671 RepID=UPI003F701AEB